MSGRQRLKVKKLSQEKTDRTLTSVMFMCNSNEAMGEESYSAFQRAIDLLIHHKLTQEDEAEEVFGKPPLVDEVEFIAYATEIGDKYKKAHFNLQVDIWHYVERYSVNKLRKRMKEWLDTYYTPKRNWNVFCSLLKRSRTNYANKDLRRIAYKKMNAKPELQTELRRLSGRRKTDPRMDELADMVDKLTTSDSESQ
jgi:hypothetical protein